MNIRTGQIKFCDMDNARIRDYPIDAQTYILRYYAENRDYDETADAYMHNLLTMSMLYGIDKYESVIGAINHKKIKNNQHFQQSAKQTFLSMKKPESFDGKYLIKSLKKL